MNRRIVLVVAVVAAVFGAVPALALDVASPPVSAFISQMVRDHRFDRGKLEKLLAGVQPDPQVIALMEKPAESLPWYRYRGIFVTPGQAFAGSVFVEENGELLAAAQRKYGVPPTIVAALIGMESHYGRSEGGHSALTALATLAFDYPRRAAYFQKELAAYLLLCRANDFDPAAIKSSYAGALGAAQFMPSSYLAYAVGPAGKGSGNLFDNWSDIIASVAHYLAVHGWRAGEPIVASATLPAGLDGIKLTGTTRSVGELRAKGIMFRAAAAATAPARLVEVEPRPGRSQYWVGLPNFLVIMTYNHSVLYALAATQLGEAIDRDKAAVPASSGMPRAPGRG